MFIKRVLVVVLTLHIIFPAGLFAQQLPRPTDRWRATSAGSMVTDVPLLEGSVLPELDENGIKSGEANLEYSSDGKSLIVDQQSAKLLAYWKNFNIGKSNSVDYQQPDSSALAVNLIRQESPSQILGSLKCNGACWFLNPNGVIFGAESTVDTRGLIAAAMEFNGLPMDGELTDEQLAQFDDDPIFNAINRGEAFLVNAKDIAEGTDGLPAIRLMQEVDENGDVLSRANINSEGAPVLLAAPVVVNEGEINSEGGQVVLAGSRKDVYLALTNPEESSYRGYLIEVDSGDRADGERGAVINAGALTANLGNVTLVASDIVQAGVVKSSTAVDVNGSIRILARDRAAPVLSGTIASGKGSFDALYFDKDIRKEKQVPVSEYTAIGTEAGVVTLTDNSKMEVVIEDSVNADMANDGLAQPKSQLVIEGREVVMGNDAQIIAPSGEVSIRARENPTALLSNPEDSDAYFSMGKGAVIDVSGTDTEVVGVERNTVDVFITSNELRDASVQKDGPLLRKEITVDIRKGTPLFDWTVALDSVEKSAIERNASGGHVNIMAKGNVSFDDNALIDISGGKVRYEAGLIQTTRLMGSNGLVDISEADSLIPYLGVISPQAGSDVDAKWGASNWFRPTPSSLRNYREEYFEGFDAGSLTITTPKQQIADSVKMKADTVIGRYQRGTSDSPSGGAIDFQLKGLLGRGADVYIVSEADSIADQLAFGETQISQSLLEESGAANVTIDNQLGIVYQDVDVDLDLDQGTDLEYSGTSVYVFGDIRTPGGDVSLTQTLFTPGDNNGRDIDGYLTVNGLINTSGTWSNDNPAVTNSLAVPFLDAGDIDIRAIGELNVGNAAGFYANAGGWAQRNGKLSIGKAGDITVLAQQGDNNPAVLMIDPATKFVALDNQSGGKLTVAAKNVTITNSEVAESAVAELGEDISVSSSFFDSTDVGAYQFVALNGNVTVESGTAIDLSHKSLVADENYRTAKSDRNAGNVLQMVTLPDYVETAGSLTLEAQSFAPNSREAGILVVEEGSSITGPAKSSVELIANSRVHVDGDMQITGGKLQAALVQTEGENASRDNYIFVGDNANLDFSAGAIAIPSTSVETSKVLVDAGSVSLNALFGSVLVSSDANIKLAGAMVKNKTMVYSGEDPQGKLETIYTPLAAGNFAVAAEQGFSVASEIEFGQAGRGYAGGEQTYLLSSGLTYKRLDGGQASTDTSGFNYVSRKLEILLGADPVAAEIAFGELIDNDYVGKGTIAAGNLDGEHVAQITINTDHTKTTLNGLTSNKVSVIGDVTVAADSSVVLATPILDLDVADTSGHLTVNAAHVQLGEDNSRDSDRQSIETAEVGTGILDIQTQLLDVAGNLSVSGADAITVDASEGVRVRAKAVSVGSLETGLMPTVLQTAGNLSIDTPMLWGETLADHRFDLIGDESVFTLQGAGDDRQLLSVGANLAVSANDISIDGVIGAPFGSINLEAQNAVTLGENSKLDVSGSGNVPFGRVQVDGVAWVYQLAAIGVPLSFDKLPEKRISIEAPTLAVADGADLDLSGGGEVYGREFVAGLGGSEDVLSRLPYSDGFVIVPSQQSGFSPYDIMEFAGSNIPWGTNFEISGSEQIQDGIYTVLPANYALLPGAILVSPLSSRPDIGAIGEGYRAYNRYGAEIVSGRLNRAGSVAQAVWSGFQVEPGSVVRQRSEFRISSADDLLLAGSPGSRPEENGRLIINADVSLAFSGTIVASQQSPIGVNFDLLSAQNIVVTQQDSADGLLVKPGLFESLAADSILIGGERHWENGAWEVNPVAENVSFDNVQFNAQELVVTAKEAITVENNSRIATTDEASFSGNRWSVSDEGALLLMSTTNGSQLDLQGVSSPDAAVVISDNSALQSSGAIGVVYDGEQSLQRMEFVGDSETRLQLASENFVIGNVDTGAVVDGQLLEAAKLTEIKASDSIRFNQTLNASLTEAQLRTGTIAVDDAAQVSLVAADSILLEAAADTASSNFGTDGGELYLAAPSVFIAGNPSDAGGGRNVLNINARLLDVNADNGLFVAGANQLNTAGDVNVVAPGIAATEKSSFDLVSQGSVTIGRSETSAELLGDYAPAAIYNIVANNDVSIDTTISAKSGAIQLQSKTGSVIIADRSRLDVSAYNQQFTDTYIVLAPAGIVSVVASENIQVADSNSFVFGDISFGSDNLETTGSGGLLELIAQGDVNLANSVEPAEWSNSGIDLNVRAARLSQSFDELLYLTANGFDGDVSVLLTGDNENINLVADQSLSADSLNLATLNGSLVVDGDIEVDNAKNSQLHGGLGVVLSDTAKINMQSQGGATSNSSELRISSDSGGVQIAAATELLIDGGLKIIKSVSDTLTDVVVDATDSISGALGLVVSESSQKSSFNQADLELAANSLIAKVDAIDVSSFVTTADQVDVLPLLDIYSDTSLNVGSLELYDLLTQAGNPGILQLRSAGELSVSGGINAATRPVDPYGIDVLLNNNSWGVSLVSGADTTTSHNVLNVFAPAAGLTIASGGFVQTGTGDINVLASGDVNLRGNAFIASMGQVDYKVVEPSILGYLEGENLPVWGDKDFAALYFLMSGSSGFSKNSGDINVSAMGNMYGEGDSQTPAEFINRLSFDNLGDDFGDAYKELLSTDKVRAWLLASNQVRGGIHAVAGGDVNVLAKGDIENIGFSTPSVGEGYTHDYQVTETPGGKLSVQSFRNIFSSSFANNGASISLRALGSITNAVGAAGSSLFMGSNTDINAIAGGDIKFDAAVNQFAVPTRDTDNELLGLNPYTGSTFVHGFDNTSLNLYSVAGDLKRSNAKEGVLYFLPKSRFSTLYLVNNTDAPRDLRFRLLPSNVTFMAFDGNIVLADPGENVITRDSLFLYPDAESSISLFAGKNIVAGSDELTVRLPDLNSSVVAGISDYYSTGVGVNGDFISDTNASSGGSGSLKILTSLDKPVVYHSDTLILRDAGKSVNIVALDGNIGDGDDILFELPIPAKVYSGGDIVNTSFDIQHSNFGSISEIVAKGDIRFPISVADNGELEKADLKAIRLAGPGDLIISAGGNVDLGTIAGIESVGNLDNPTLPSGGASVHVYAGFNRLGDYKALLGKGVENNTKIAALKELADSDESINSLSAVAWFWKTIEKEQSLNLSANIEETQNTIKADELSETTKILLSHLRRASGEESYRSFQQAIQDWNGMDPALRLRIAVSSMKELALADPKFFVANGDVLFANPKLGEAGFSSPQQRQEAFENYWNGIGSLIALEYLLTPDREADFKANLPVGSNQEQLDLETFAQLPVSMQLNIAVATFDNVTETTQMLVAEQIMLDHTKQGGREGFAARNALLNFERGYVAQRMFFGTDYDSALAGIAEKVSAIQSGKISTPDSVHFGSRDNRELSSVQAVFDAWGLSSGIDFLFDENTGSDSAGDISLVFSTVRSLAGGDVNLLAPSGSVDVGLAIAQLDELGVVDLEQGTGKQQNQLGVLAMGLGDVNGIVANAYNVNQSRSFSLAGGDMNLWSSYGDIDAGRGAKTTFVSPSTEFQISTETGQIIFVKPPAFAGSGIRTSESRSGSNKELTDSERFYQLADGAGGTYLATALGIVDAGEAGIESAGDLFIAAAEVRGADNINVGGVSVGVATDTTISGSVASVGNAANAATESAQSAATSGVSGAEEEVTAFVTIELLDTGT